MSRAEQARKGRGSLILAVADWCRVFAFVWLCGAAGLRVRDGVGLGSADVVFLVVMAALLPGALNPVVAIVRELRGRHLPPN